MSEFIDQYLPLKSLTPVWLDEKVRIVLCKYNSVLEQCSSEKHFVIELIMISLSQHVYVHVPTGLRMVSSGTS